MADGKVYVCTKSKLITFAAGEERKVLSEVLLGSSAYSTPVAANGTLVVCSQSYIWAVQKGARPAVATAAIGTPASK